MSSPRPSRPVAARRHGLLLAVVVAVAACGGSPAAVVDGVADGQGAAPGSATTASAPAEATTTAPASTSSVVAATSAPASTTAAAPAERVPASTTTSCRSVAHLGDSTSVGLISPAYLSDPAQRIDAQYRRVGAVDQRLEISGARSIVETLPGQVNARDTAAQLKASGFDGCWVLALGTTDTANVAVGSNVSRRERIDRMMAVTGDDPVLWVNVKTLVGSGAWSDPNMQLWNQELLAAQARYPTLQIYDWATVVQDAWFSSDRIHYTSAGYAERARLIADALAATYPA